MEIQRTIPVEERTIFVGGGEVKVRLQSRDGKVEFIRGEGVVGRNCSAEDVLDKCLERGWRGEYEMRVTTKREFRWRFGFPPLRVQQRIEFWALRGIQ